MPLYAAKTALSLPGTAITGTLTIGSNLVPTTLGSYQSSWVGETVTGPGISLGTTISAISIQHAVASFTLTSNATLSGTRASS